MWQQPALERGGISALEPAGALVAGVAISDCPQLNQVSIQDMISPSHAKYRVIKACSSARSAPTAKLLCSYM